MKEEKGTGAVPGTPAKIIRLVINGIHARSGGGVTYIRDLVPKLAAFPDMEVHLLLHRNQFNLFYPVDENIRVHLFDFSQQRLATLFWEQVAIPLMARDMGADIVFSPANYGPFFARNHVILLRNAVSVRKVQRSLRGKGYWFSLGLATFASILTARKAIAVSEFAKTDLTFGFAKFLDYKIPVIHHGTRLQGMDSDGPGGGTGDLLAVSDIYVQKNYHTLLRAFALLRQRYPGLRLTIAGQALDEIYLTRIKTIIDDLDLGGGVRFLGNIEPEELWRLYRNCRVFIFPSLVETFGNPLLEAMAAGAAIACSNRAAMPEVLGDAGLMFDPLVAEDMAEKIGMLLDDVALRKTLSGRAVQRASGFTWEQTATATRAVFEEITNAEATRRKDTR